MSRRFVAVIFDMDGTLVDSEPVHVEAMRRVLAPHGVSYTDEDNEQFFGFTDLEVFRQLNAERGLALNESDLTQQRLALIVDMMKTECVPMDGVPDVLQALRAGGYRLALASSSAIEVIDATLAALGVASLFDVTVSGLTLGRGKPAPDIFLVTAERLGVTPRDCLVIEDSRNGLLAAKAAGMACAVIPCPATRSQNFTEADWKLERLPDVIPLLA